MGTIMFIALCMGTLTILCFLAIMVVVITEELSMRKIDKLKKK